MQQEEVQDQHYDAIIIGAGISGISAAYHLQSECPDKRYRILERRENLGGTWDLFNYPGIRSDSDMYTFGFSFRPWTDDSAIAEKSKILDYLRETTEEYGIDDHIAYSVHVKNAEWDSIKALWTITAIAGGKPRRYTAQHIFMCVGYYDYDQGYQPHFPAQESFTGQVVHPQHWPTDLNYQDKRVVIIGSGATAVTLLPAMADTAAKVTMLQRSPTYMGAKPAKDPIANRLANWFGRRAARWWFILTSMFLYGYCRLFPARAKQKIIDGVAAELGADFDPKHFTPRYMPWDERLCLCPDGDFFEAMKRGKAEVVTDQIERFTPTGLKLSSGSELEADIIVTATGLKLLFAGGIDLVVDGQAVTPGDTLVYKGMMCAGVPNLYLATGYTNASWTLKVDLTNKYACRLINHLDRMQQDYCVPEADPSIEPVPLLDLKSGYIQRDIVKFPKQANTSPWRLYQNYLYDKFTLAFGSLRHPQMGFYQKQSEPAMQNIKSTI